MALQNLIIVENDLTLVLLIKSRSIKSSRNLCVVLLTQTCIDSVVGSCSFDNVCAVRNLSFVQE